MSKSSCEAAESIEDAVLRMARVNGDVGRETLFYVVKIVRKGQEQRRHALATCRSQRY